MRIGSAVWEQGEGGVVDFEHKEHAESNVLRHEGAMEFYESLEAGGCPLAGYASDIRVVASASHAGACPADGDCGAPNAIWASPASASANPAASVKALAAS